MVAEEVVKDCVFILRWERGWRAVTGEAMSADSRGVLIVYRQTGEIMSVEI